MRLGDLPIPEGVSARIIQVRRGDIDLPPKPDLRIEFGDQLGVLIESAQCSIVSRFFGDSIKAEKGFSFVSLALGLVIGGLIGLIPIPIPGIGSVKLGAAGGPLNYCKNPTEKKMKKFFIVSLLVMFVFASTSVFAAERYSLGMSNVALKVDYLNFTDDVFDNIDLDEAIYVGLEGCLAVMPNLYLGMETGWAGAENDDKI
jgi:hypothetical protein